MPWIVSQVGEPRGLRTLRCDRTPQWSGWASDHGSRRSRDIGFVARSWLLGAISAELASGPTIAQVACQEETDHEYL